MVSSGCELYVNAERWTRRRSLKPKGKRKARKLGGKAKRRRRKYNLNNLKNSNGCVCHPHCTCLENHNFVDAGMQTDPQITSAAKNTRTQDTDCSMYAKWAY